MENEKKLQEGVFQIFTFNLHPGLEDTTQDWCDCGTGKSYVDVWDINNPDDKYRVNSGNPMNIIFKEYVPVIGWQCDRMENPGQSTLDGNTKEWYVNLHTERKFPCNWIGEDSGRLGFSTPGKIHEGIIYGRKHNIRILALQ